MNKEINQNVKNTIERLEKIEKEIQKLSNERAELLKKLVENCKVYNK